MVNVGKRLKSAAEGYDRDQLYSPADALEIVKNNATAKFDETIEAAFKLPFSVPDDPLVEARGERLRERGLDPFRHDAVPEAVLRFRQGVGRLIRRATGRMGRGVSCCGIRRA